MPLTKNKKKLLYILNMNETDQWEGEVGGLAWLGVCVGRDWRRED